MAGHAIDKLTSRAEGERGARVTRLPARLVLLARFRVRLQNAKREI